MRLARSSQAFKRSALSSNPYLMMKSSGTQVSISLMDCGLRLRGVGIRLSGSHILRCGSLHDVDHPVGRCTAREALELPAPTAAFAQLNRFQLRERSRSQMSDCDSPMAYRSPTKGTGTSASGSGATAFQRTRRRQMIQQTAATRIQLRKHGSRRNAQGGT